MVCFSVKLLAIGWDIDPQATFAADGAGALNDESYFVGWQSGRWQVQVLPRNIGRTVILQWQKVDGLGVLDGWWHSCC